MAASSALFATMAVLVRGCKRLPVQEMVLARSLLNVTLTLALIRAAGVRPLGGMSLSLFLRGLFGYAALSLHFYALTHLPLADAIVIHNTAPLLVALLAPLVLGERGGPLTLVLSGLGLAGVALIVRPTGDVGLLPGLAAAGGAVMSALAYLTIRSIGRREHPLVVVLYFPLIAIVLSAGPALRDFVAPTATEGVLLLGIGVTTTLAQVALTRALQLERAADATSVAYTSIAFTAALGWLVFGEVPDGRTILGTSMVLGAALLVARLSPPADRAPASAPPSPQPESPRAVVAPPLSDPSDNMPVR